MRGYDQTRNRVRHRAWCWLILGIAAVPGPIQAQDARDSAASGHARDPIDLAADHIQTWQDGDARWFVLSGQIAVIQGDEGLRAKQAVVRVTTPDGPGVRAYQAEVYAEGGVLPIGPRVSPRPSLRMTLRSTQDIQLKPYEESGLVRMPGPPASPPRLVSRGFPQASATANVSATAPATAPTQRQPATIGTSAAAIPTQRPMDRPEAPAPARALPSPVEVPPPAVTVLPPDVALPPPVEAQAPAEMPKIVALPASELPTLSANPATTSPAPTAAIPAPTAAIPAPTAAIPDVGPGSPASDGTTAPRDSGATTGAGRDAPRTVVRADGIRDNEQRAVRPTQFQAEEGMGGPGGADIAPLAPPSDGPEPALPEGGMPANEPPPLDQGPVVPDLSPPREGPGTTLEALPGPDGRPLPPLDGREALPYRDPKAPADILPILPGTQRVTRIYPRNGGPDYSYETLKTVDGGVDRGDPRRRPDRLRGAPVRDH